MTEHAHVEVYRGHRIVIDYDEDRLNPRKEMDNMGTMICFHGRYRLGDEHGYRDPKAFVEKITGLDTDELGSNPNDDLGDGSKYRIVWEPLYLYDHSGITMSTSPFSCPWDSGQVGVIYVTYEDVWMSIVAGPPAEMPKGWIPDADVIAQAEAILKGEVETYDQYLRGDVYTYAVYGPVLEAERGDDIDEDHDDYWNEDSEESCGDCYGLEYTIKQAKEAIDALCSEG